MTRQYLNNPNKYQLFLHPNHHHCCCWQPLTAATLFHWLATHQTTTPPTTSIERYIWRDRNRERERVEMAKPNVIFGGKTTGVAFRAALVHHEDKIPQRSTNLTPRISPSPLLPEPASSLIRDGHIHRRCHVCRL